MSKDETRRGNSELKFSYLNSLENGFVNVDNKIIYRTTNFEMKYELFVFCICKTYF